jgi:hypothetical protein
MRICALRSHGSLDSTAAEKQWKTNVSVLVRNPDCPVCPAWISMQSMMN